MDNSAYRIIIDRSEERICRKFFDLGDICFENFMQKSDGE